MQPHEKIIVALDVPTLDAAKRHVAELAPYVGYFKVGSEFITAVGAPAAVAVVHEAGGKVMFDAKFFDIPNTMAGSAHEAVFTHGVDLFTIHASASRDGIRAVVKAVGGDKVVGVTVLTSMSETDCQYTYGDSVEEKVDDFASLLSNEGVGWLVCSPQDLRTLREPGIRRITPGVRPTWASADDQKRVETPRDAILLGADMLVIGRPILKPPPSIGSSVEAVKRIIDEIAQALK